MRQRLYRSAEGGSAPRREKIAILGGGMASLSAAFALTDTAELRGRYALTVYQDGWLLGGKGASVRNREAHGRIEEHGLHVWLGYYENAFTLLRRCYEELGRPPGAAMRTLRDAFIKHGAIVVGEKTRRGWEHWSVTFPETDDWPGDGRPLPGPGEAIRSAAVHVLRYALDWWKQGRGGRPEVDDVAGQLRSLLKRVLTLDGPLLVGGAARALADGLRSLLERLRALARRDLELDTHLRRVWIVLEFSAISLIGILRDGILGPDVDVEALDELEYTDWLRKHGASEMTVSSGLIRAFYHLAFCDGAGAGAGLAVLGMLRMFTCYRGAVFYKMRAGMGETVFAPLYEVLRRRGVRFEFFHRVQRLELSDDQRSVERVVIGRQATPRDGAYHPLVDVGGLPCWPEQPLYGQLVEGEALARHGAGLASFWSDWPFVEQRTLRRGTDFDQVLLGISVGALPFVASELIEASPKWRRMVEHVQTVRTVSMQLWVTEPLGPLASSEDAPVMTAYQVPLETWANMSHLVPVEGWTARDGVQGIFYACGQLGRGDDPVAASDPRATDRAALEAVARASWESSWRTCGREARRRAVASGGRPSSTRRDAPGPSACAPSTCASTPTRRTATCCRCRARRSTASPPMSRGSRGWCWRGIGRGPAMTSAASRPPRCPGSWRRGRSVLRSQSSARFRALAPGRRSRSRATSTAPGRCRSAHRM
ncbi:NAD(P)-binding protein [Pyxidicoccus sp. 3LG]